MGDQPKQPRREPGHKKASSLNAQEDRQLEPENRDRYHTLHQRLNVTPKELVSSARGRLEQLDAIGRRLNHIRTTAEQLESQLEDLDDLIVRFGLLAWERIMMSLVRMTKKERRNWTWKGIWVMPSTHNSTETRADRKFILIAKSTIFQHSAMKTALICAKKLQPNKRTIEATKSTIQVILGQLSHPAAISHPCGLTILLNLLFAHQLLPIISN